MPLARTPILIALTAAVIAAPSRAYAQSDTASHKHDPVTVPSPPVISRLKVAYATPRRIAVMKTGHILVADTRAGVVFRTAPDGITSVLANGLRQPVGLSVDDAGNVYVATAGNGETRAGRIHRVTPDGERETLPIELSGPADMVRDDTGFVTVALTKRNEVVRFNPDGEPTVICNRIRRPTALARGRNGELFVASATGSVFQLLANGRTRQLIADLKQPTDLTVTADGRLVIADSSAAHLLVLSAGGETRPFAKVPRGTVAVAFTAEGNMVVANSEYQSVTRVTTRMSIPCPHCEQSIPLILKKPAPTRSAF